MKKLLLVLLLMVQVSWAADSRRIVFVGDSITGQGGGWVNAGYVFKMGGALAAVRPDAKAELIPLGGSGMGIGSWLGLAKDEARQDRQLDIGGVNVKQTLAQEADTLVIMLGMNDVLAPYVNESDASLDKWQADYRELIRVLSQRLKPRVIALATITPQTESPDTPKNLVMARMNQRIAALAAEFKGVVLPTNATYWEVLGQGRKVNPTYSLASDRIHPGSTGHTAIAVAMLSGLGDEAAANWLREGALAKSLTGLIPGIEQPASPPWLVASGLILRGWQEQPAEADLQPNPIDLAIERGEDFTLAPVKEGGEPLTWKRFQSSIALTHGASDHSVDFAGITFGQNFEAGYGARWIHTEEPRKLRLQLSSSGVGSVIHLTVWMNGKKAYAGMITSEPGRRAVQELELKAGWNTLVFKSCHRTWQWQQHIMLSELSGATAKGLEYRAAPPE